MFSYQAFPGWWYSLLGTLLIIILAKRCWPNEYLDWTGLKISSLAAISSLFLLLVVVIGSLLLMSSIASNAGVSIKIFSISIFIHIIGYTLNEEILIGALLLNYLKRRFINLKRYLISLLVAAVFSILHYVFYRWIFLDRGLLTIVTLISLFAVGFIRNNLILLTGHIGYSWAIHAGWVFIMFGLDHTNNITQDIMGEPERFNLYLGSLYTLATLSVVAILSLWFLIRKKQFTSYTKP